MFCQSYWGISWDGETSNLTRHFGRKLSIHGEVQTIMKIVIPDDYGGEPSQTPPNLRASRSLGEVAHFTERPRDDEEMAERILDAEIILTVRFQTDFKNTGLLDAARGLRFISIWGTRPRAVDMKRAEGAGRFRRRDARSGESLRSRTHDDDGPGPGEAAAVSRTRHAGGCVGAGVQGVEILGKSLSVVGFGHIGSKVVPMARGFGMDVLAWSKNMTPERAAKEGARAASLDECVRADFVTIQLHVTPETRGIISRERIAQMKPTAFLINTSRAALVDMDALFEALSASGA